MAKDFSPFTVLRLAQFRNYLLGAFISELGNQMQTVAVSWQVYELTRNPISLGFIGVANFLPILLFSLIGGLVADKVNRKRLLLSSQIAQTILAFVLFSLSFFHLINPWLIYLILVFITIAQSFSIPVRQAVMPNLVPKSLFMNAVSLGTLQFQAAIMIGPAVAGFVIGHLGVSWVYLLNSLSFLFFIVAILAIKISLQRHNTENIELSLSSVKEGISFVLSTPILYSTMILDFLATFFGEAEVLMPIYAKEILHVGPSGLGFLYSAPAIGGILAGLLVASLHHKLQKQGYVIVGSVILYGIATIGFGLSKTLSISLIFLVLVGFGDMVSTIIRNTIRQMVTPDYLRGRMSSITRIFFQGGPQLGEIEAGFLAKLIGAPLTVVSGGIGVIIITALIALKGRSLREYQGKELTV